MANVNQEYRISYANLKTVQNYLIVKNNSGNRELCNYYSISEILVKGLKEYLDQLFDIEVRTTPFICLNDDQLEHIAVNIQKGEVDKMLSRLMDVIDELTH